MDADGAVYTMGCPEYGQLGNGNTDNQLSPIAISVPGAPVIQVSGGYIQSYATAADGTVYAWGYNAQYQLGDGTNTTREGPIKVRMSSVL